MNFGMEDQLERRTQLFFRTNSGSQAFGKTVPQTRPCWTFIKFVSKSFLMLEANIIVHFPENRMSGKIPVPGLGDPIN